MTACTISIGQNSPGNGCVAILATALTRRGEAALVELAAKINGYWLTTIVAAAGGCSFAEKPNRDANQARIAWTAELDPVVLHADAAPATSAGSEGFDIATPGGWRATVVVSETCEHLLLERAHCHLRIDLAHGSLLAGPALLEFKVSGSVRLTPQLRALQRFGYVLKGQPPPRFLEPSDRRTARWIQALRVHDALADGATLYDIGRALFGADRIEGRWRVPSDAMLPRVRRLVDLTRTMEAGGYRRLFEP